MALGRKLVASGAAQVGGSFTDVPEADALVKSSPNAFLLGVLFTQGIPAERAWAGPWELSRRLGHLDLERLACEREAVEEAFARRPCLHRFKRTLPRWVSAAAAKVLAEYGGDASAIWAEGSTVVEVTQRLASFPGIGRKKAAMAVGILMRHFGVPLDGVEHGRVAYDVHVRRVFLRTGLAAADTPEAIEGAAAEAYPEAPATLDLAAWLVGRDWCRPSAPDCDACPLGGECPRRVWVKVEGVGARRR